MNIKKTILILACIITLALCGTVSAADTSNITVNNSNSSFHSLQSSTSVKSTSNQIPDPIISGVVKDNSTNKGLGGVTIRVIQNNAQVAQTTTHNDGTYSLNFISSKKSFTIIASKLGYMPISKTITVVPSSNLSDPNLYGTANFRLYNLLKYSGSASSYVLNVGALPDILADIYAGKSSALVNSTSPNYSKGGGTPLEVKLLTGSLLAGLLDVYSTGDEGSKIGGLLPSNNASLLSSLKLLGIYVGLLSANSNSSATLPQSSGSGEVASIDVGIKLLQLLDVLSLNADLITANSSVTPNFNTGILISSSNAGVADITLTLLGIPLLEIEALQSNAVASVNGKPGGATAKFTWNVADIKALGISILDDLTLNGHVNIGLLGLNILTLSLGSTKSTTSADGTYAKASGDALRLQILGLLGGGLVNLVIGHADAEAQVPAGGLYVNTSDLEITKTVDNTRPNYLQNVTFTLKVHNNGPDNATGVTVLDKLPAGLKFISASGNGTYNFTTGTWTIGSLANGGEAILNIIAQVVSSNTQITNIANITGTNYDPEPGNDQANATVNVSPASDLGITKTVNKTTANYMDKIRYTITVTNNGPDASTNIIVNDYLPNSLQWISDNSNGAYNHDTGIWTIDTLSNGASITLNIIAQIVKSNTVITNIATVNNNTYDQNPTNNQDQTTTTVSAASDLNITKTVNNTHPNYLDKVTFTITAHNNGPDTATGVVVTDKLPAGLTWVSDNSNGAYNPTTGIWTIGNLANGESAILKIIAQITASNTQITNIAGINGTNYDQNSTNNESNITVTVDPASDLGIIKTVNNKHPNYLENVTYTIKVHNYGPDAATGVTVTDKLPTGLKFISTNGNYNPTTGIWTIGTLANGGEAILNIIAQVIASNTQITNIARVNGDNYDQNSTNNESNTTITVNPASDLKITKTVNNTHPNYLENIKFTLTVHNNGPDTATGVVVLDKLPNGLKFISSTGNYDPKTGIWAIGTITNGKEAVLNIIAQVIASNTQITNIAGVKGDNYDQNSTNNQSNATVTINPASDLEINKTVNKTTANYMDKIRYTITVTNNGPDASTNIIVNDYLPNSLQWISDDGNGKYNHNTGIWAIDALSNGVSITLNIIAQIMKSNTVITNIATVNNNTYDQNPTNNQDKTTTTVSAASDLNITKTVNNTHPNYLQNITYTITAHNNGPDTATGVVVTDKLPAGLTWISDNSNGAYNPTTGTWTIGNIANGESVILKIIAQITASNTQITNIASINGTNYDQNSTNNESNTTITVDPASDLGITKTVNNTHPNYLDKVTFTLTAHNYGPDTATGVIVLDKLPTGLKFISSNGNYDSATGVWTIGNLANGATAVLNIIAQVTASNTRITNIAGINGANYDQNSTNNQSNTTVIINPASDLEITKTVNNPHPKYLQNVTFTLTAHNYGPDNATGVKVTDKLPAGLKFISARGNGIYDSATGIWTIGNLANGTTAVLNIITQAISPNIQVTNIANITGTNYDQNSTNDQDNATVNVGPASDLGIVITVNNAHPKYLDYVTFTLTAHNYGPNDAAYVKVYNTLPDKLKYVSDDSNGAFDSTTGLWTVGYMANGATAVLHIIAQAMASEVTLTDVARITDPDPVGTTEFYDPNQDNDQASISLDVGSAADLSITKKVNNMHPNYLDNVTFTLTVHNNGPNNATGVIVTDKLPTGLKFVSSNGNYDPATGTWTIGTLTNGKEAILNIIAQVIASNTQITNIARVNGDNYDQNSTNDESNSTVTVNPASDLKITKTVNNTHPNYLENIKFTLTAYNNGPDTTTGVVVLDKLPNGLKFISSTGNYDPATGIWTVGTLTNGQEAILNIIAQVTASNIQITNIASINGDNYDQNSSNNQSNATVIVNAASDLEITKTVNNTHPKYLQNVTYTLKVYNNGPDNATGVTVLDKLPTGLKFISSNGNYNSATGIWTIGNLANGATAVLNIIAQVTASNTQITNIAGVNGTNYDQNSTNNQSNTTINVDLASDLGIIKTVNNSKPNYLQNVTFTLTAHNYGPDNAAGVKVTDKLPAGLKFISVSGYGTYNSTTGVWTIGNLANGATAVLKIIAQAVSANTQVVNTASITGTNYDQNSTNDQSSATVNIKPASDLGIKITVNNANPKYLDYVTFTLTAHNYGPNDAAYVKVYNTLPDKLKYVSDDSKSVFNSTTGLWTVGYMANGATAVLRIIAQAMASNVSLTDVAHITDPDPVGTTEFYDPNQDNDQASISLDVDPAADLSITKTVNSSKPNYLQNIIYTLTAHNNGPNGATGVIVTDKLPNGLKFISTSGNGKYNSTTGTWTIGNMANGATAVLKIVAQVVTPNTQLVNTASITGHELDLDTTNNNANASVTVGLASDLGITKTVNNTNPKYLQKVTFTLTAHNYGPNNATGVTVTDKLPAGLKFISSNGNYDSTTGIWTIGTLANGATAVLKIVVQATSPSKVLTNIATINGTNYDQNSTNNKGNASVKVGPAADLAVKLSVSNAHPKCNQKVTFTITAYNYGPMNAKNVTVTLKMPKGFKYISKDKNIQYNSKTGVWTIGNLKNGGKLVLHILAQAVVSNVRLTSTASIKGTAIMK